MRTAQSTVSEPQGRTAWAFGEAVYNERRIVESLLEKDIVPLVLARGIRTSSEKAFFEQFQRVRSWVDSLGRLANPNDYQAVNAGVRALAELAIDLTLLRFARVDFPPEKILAWEDSAKLKAAKAIERYYKKAKTPVPSKFQAQLDFIRRSGESVAAASAKYGWLDDRGRPKHPQRWTGANLEIDARRAQEVTPTEFPWPMNLEEFYATRYSQTCWNVHGSGAAGVRFVPESEVPSLGSLPMHECNELAVRSAELVLIEFGVLGASAKAALEKCRKERLAMLTTVLRHHDPAFLAEVMPVKPGT